MNPLCIDPIFKVLLQMATTTYLCFGDRRRALAKIEKEGGRTRTHDSKTEWRSNIQEVHDGKGRESENGRPQPPNGTRARLKVVAS